MERVKRIDTLDRHIAPNYIAMTTRGRFDREEAVKQLQTIDLQSYAISNMPAKLTTDTFVVTYDVNLHGTANGQMLPDAPSRVLAVWQKQKAGWLLLAHSVVRQ